MAQSKVGNFIKILGFLTVIGTIIAKLMPLLQKEKPKLKKKLDKIGGLLLELKDEISEMGAEAAKSTKKK